MHAQNLYFFYDAMFRSIDLITFLMVLVEGNQWSIYLLGLFNMQILFFI